MSDFREPGARGAELHTLLQEVLSGNLDVGDFCEAFERVYNLETDKATLTERERVAFKVLFERIVWYSPIAEERRTIPNYVGESEVLDAARSAAVALGE